MGARRIRLTIAAVGSLATLLALSLAAWAAGLSAERPQTSGANRRSGLVVSGSVKGLYPGARAGLRVTVGNRSGFRLKVVSVTAKAADASPGCERVNLSVGRFRGRLLVPARRARAVTLQVAMTRSAPDACRGAVFRLALRAQGVRP